MNLHSFVAGYVGAVNPNQIVSILSAVGTSKAADGSRQAAYATPGQITASIGGTFTASASGTTLSVSAVLSGSLQAGDAVSGTDGINSLPAYATIVQQLTGTPGGVGTYELSAALTSGTLNSCTVTSASSVLNVSAVASGVLQAGQTVADSGLLAAGTLITDQLSGAGGGAGLYNLSNQQTVASETMTTSTDITAQVQALTGTDLRHVDMLNLQGSHRVLYANLNIRGIVRIDLRGGDLVKMADGSVWLVQQVLEPWHMTAGWQKCLITLQDGS